MTFMRIRRSNLRRGPGHGWRACIRRGSALTLVLLAMSLVAGCEEQTAGVGITGIDHLPDHLSVQDFYVDGYSAFRAGGSGGAVCCALLPKRWRPDLTVEIRWNVTNWRDCEGNDYVRRVLVEPYSEPGRLWVHFLRNGEVRAISSGIGPRNPDYPGPHDPIPSKRPWNIYPLDATCEAKKSAQPGGGGAPQ